MSEHKHEGTTFKADRTGPIWATTSGSNVYSLEALVSAIKSNGTLRGGIASEKDEGLPEDKWPIILVDEGVWDMRNRMMARTKEGVFLDENWEPVEYVHNSYARAIRYHLATTDMTGTETKDVDYHAPTELKIEMADAKMSVKATSRVLVPNREPTVRKEDGEFTADEKYHAVGAMSSAAKVPAGYYDVSDAFKTVKKYRHKKEVKYLAAVDDWNQGHLRSVTCSVSDDEAALKMAKIIAATAVINKEFFKILYGHGDGELEDEILETLACAVASAFAVGKLEVSTFNKPEVRFAKIKIVDNKVQVLEIECTAAMTTPVDSLIQAYDLDDVKHHVNAARFEVGAGCSVLAGLQHYSTNHTLGTRGGNKVLAKFMRNTGLSGSLTTHEEKINPWKSVITADNNEKRSNLIACYYNATHPVSKRGIACSQIEGSNVHSYAQLAVCPVGINFALDTFLSIRTGIKPAGTALGNSMYLILTKIADRGISFALPWQSDLPSVVIGITKLMGGGAENHVGARYYTDENSLYGQQAMSQYASDVAYYAQTAMAGSSIAASPHLSFEKAQNANPVWKSVVNAMTGTLKGAFDGPTIEKITAQVGGAIGDTDITTDEGIAAAVAKSKAFGAQLSAFRSFI